jgi:hypothetical protein
MDFEFGGNKVVSRDANKKNLLKLFFYPGHMVVQLVEALCYKPEGHGFESQ